MRLHFDHALVARLLAHSLEATARRAALDQMLDPAYHLRTLKPGTWPSPEDIDATRIPAGLWLVGDEGVYLMSNGLPGFQREADGKSLIAYAREADPTANPEAWHSVKCASFGGDDGCEFLSADSMKAALSATQGSALWLDVMPDAIASPIPAPVRKPARRKARA